MAKVVLIYFSVTGTTATLAEAIKVGAAEISDVAQHRIVQADAVEGRWQCGGAKSSGRR